MHKLNKVDIQFEVILGILMCSKAQILCVIFKEFAEIKYILDQMQAFGCCIYCVYSLQTSAKPI